MSNDSLHSLPWFSAESYNRVLGATPPEDSPPDFFYVPGRTFVLVNRPLPPRPITPRPITPRPVAPAFDFSQDAQQFVFSWSPPALRDAPIGYSEMTQTSSSPHSPDMFPPTTLQQSTPTTLRQSQIEEWLRSSSMSTIVPAENDSLIFGGILSTSQPSQNETGWADDGYENIMVMHMSAHEGQWYKDEGEGEGEVFDTAKLTLLSLAFLSWIAAALNIITQGSDDLDRKYWPWMDPQLVAESLFTMATVMAYLRLLFLCQLNYYIGPMQVSLGKVLQDFGKFATFLLIIMAAFTCGLGTYYSYYAGMVHKDPETGDITR
ncbi:hypothetical protein QTP88_022950 [Uroleucon formosanum]